MSADSTTSSPRPLVYVAGGLTGAPRGSRAHLQLYKRIQQGCERAGFAAYLPHEDTGPREADIRPRRVFDANISALRRSVAVVAELSVPSHGVGMEVQYALTRGIPVIGIASAKREISRMIAGHPSMVDLRRYHKVEQIPQTVAELLGVYVSGIRQPRSHIIAIEGPDFVGKSRLVSWLQPEIEKVTQRNVLITTDPPFKLDPWDRIQSVFRSHKEITPMANALLFLTARVDNYERCILPAVQRGDIVIADRFIDSWFAYQSVRLAKEGKKLLNTLEFLMGQQMFLESFSDIGSPGLAILLMATLDELEARSRARKDRDEWERMEIQERVIEAYELLHERLPHRIVRVETTGRTEKEVQELVMGIVRAYLRFHGFVGAAE